MSNAVRFTRKTSIQKFRICALLLVSLSSFLFVGCSGLVTANNTGGPPPPLAISGVQAGTPTATGFKVIWTTNVAANSGVDYGATVNYGSSTATNSSMVISHQVALTGLAAGTLYHFRVRSTDANNSSASGPDTTFSTASNTTPPAVSITSPAANATLSGVVTLSASATANGGATVASVQFKVDGLNTGAPITAAPYNYSLNTSTLSNGNHTITAVATDTSGNTGTSAGVVVKVTNTVTSAPSITGLNPASGLVGTAVTITGANFGATQGTSTVTFNGTTATPTSWSATSIVAPVPAGATTGNVVVTVGSAASNGVSFTVQADTTPPTVPTGLTATAISSSQINLAWAASTDNVGVTGYNIFRGGVKVGTAPSTSYQDAGLNASTSYTYNVSAFDAAGNTSAQSAAASATTQAASGGGGIPPGLGWYQIPNTNIRPLCPPYPDIQAVQGCPAVMTNWSGGLFDTKRNRQVIFGGGHSGYYGNEVYAIDLAANPIAPLLLRDASHGTGIANLSTCPEAYSDGTPSSRHTYAGLLYLANIDRYFSYGGSKAPCGYFASGVWFFDPNTATWTLQATNGGPNPSGNGSVPQAAYDPVTGNVFSQEENAGLFWQFNPTNDTWTQLANSSACGSETMMPAIDPVRRLYLCIGNGAFYQISLTAPYTGKALSGTNCGPVMAAGGPGFAYDPVQKLMVGWVGGNTVYLYNPDTDSCTTATYPNGPTTFQSLGTFGRFAYSPALGVFVVSNSIDTNAYSLRLSNSTSSALQDFQTRCAQSGVIVCQGFDDPNVFTAAAYPASGLYPGGDGVFRGAIDTTVSASGGGSLKFTVPSLAGGNASGYWRQLFTSSLSAPPSSAKMFSQNSTFYIQFRQRFSPEFLTNQWSAVGGGKTWWKQEIFSNDSSTCGQVELTTINGYDKGFPQMYSQCGADAFQVNLGNGDYLLEQGDTSTTGYNCHYQAANNGPNSCFNYPANTWVTFYYKISIGNWGLANSSIQAWVSVGGQPYQEWINMTNHTLNEDTAGADYNMATLLPYMTNRDATISAGPTAYTWYDELIVSSQPIAAPNN